MPASPHFQEPYNRIRKELLKECKQLGAGQRVLVIGNSREPYLATRKVRCCKFSDLALLEICAW